MVVYTLENSWGLLKLHRYLQLILAYHKIRLHGLKLKFNFKPRKSETYSKLDDISQDRKDDKLSAEVMIACSSCRTKDSKVCQRKTAGKCNFNDIPQNVCDDIKTDFEDIENEDVCKSLPTDTFDDIPKDTFTDIEVAIEDAAGS